MEENLVGYLIGGLDDRGRRQVEVYLDTHPEARERLAMLRRALEPLAADRDGPAPPRDLFTRTLATVAEHICNAAQPQELPKAPPVTLDTPAAPRGWWRRADVMIAASLLITTLGLLAPALLHLRSSSAGAALVACQNNLRQFYTALQTYHDVRGDYPNIAAEAPRNVAGMVVPILADAGVLPSDASVRCPGNGPHLGCDVTLASLRTMSPEQFQSTAPNLSHCYAYTLGYRDEQGAYRSPAAAGGRVVPVMADRPPSDGVLANSVNHGGAGQNVLYLDGHVRFLAARSIHGDDYFLNLNNEVAAGLNAQDTVLGYSAARP